jgi:DNA-binding NarL/FixJ family response regulator
MLNWSTGIEVMKLIREHRNESSIVILYSNITNPFIRNHCRAVGADYCLDKSNDLDQLIIICQKLISKRFPNLIPFETNYFIPKLEYVKCSGSERLRNYLTTAIGMKFLII